MSIEHMNTNCILIRYTKIFGIRNNNFVTTNKQLKNNDIEITLGPGDGFSFTDINGQNYFVRRTKDREYTIPVYGEFFIYDAEQLTVRIPPEYEKKN